MRLKTIKFIGIFIAILFFSNFTLAESKIDKAVDQTTDFLKSISKRGLTKNQTSEFLNNYAITLTDERTDGEVTYIFDSESYKRYKKGEIISEDGWRFSKLGALRVFNGDVKLTWKIKLGKQNIIIIKPKFQPIGLEYQFTYQLKKLFFEQTQ